MGLVAVVYVTTAKKMTTNYSSNASSLMLYGTILVEANLTISYQRTYLTPSLNGGEITNWQNLEKPQTYLQQSPVGHSGRRGTAVYFAQKPDRGRRSQEHYTVGS